MEKYSPRVSEEVRRWSEGLRATLYGRHETLASVERGLGWSNGYGSQVLGPGSPVLRVEQVLAILDHLEMPWEEFFRRLYGGRPKPGVGEEAELSQLVDHRARVAAFTAVTEAIRRYVEPHRREVLELLATLREVERLPEAELREVSRRFRRIVATVLQVEEPEAAEPEGSPRR